MADVQTEETRKRRSPETSEEEEGEVGAVATATARVKRFGRPVRSNELHWSMRETVIETPVPEENDVNAKGARRALLAITEVMDKVEEAVVDVADPSAFRRLEDLQQKIFRELQRASIALTGGSVRESWGHMREATTLMPDVFQMIASCPTATATATAVIAATATDDAQHVEVSDKS